jgi:hypothetical protein
VALRKRRSLSRSVCRKCTSPEYCAKPWHSYKRRWRSQMTSGTSRMCCICG